MEKHKPWIALVTGGRDFKPTGADADHLSKSLAGCVLVIEGECVGFDRFARDIARRMGIEVQPAPALWRMAKALDLPYRAEGPKRNARALRWATELGEEYDLEVRLVAGPGGGGTSGMVDKAKNLSLINVCGANW